MERLLTLRSSSSSSFVVLSPDARSEQRFLTLTSSFYYLLQCDTFVNRCGGSTANVQTCKSLASTITTRDDAAALAWNAGIE